jgi:Protein involved in ribonucleotide reduction
VPPETSIAAKCKVAYLYRYELMGTPEDTAAVRNGSSVSPEQ